MTSLSQLLKKDTLCIVRNRAVVVSSVGFALLLVVVASFGFRKIGYGQDELRDLTPGILALVFLFSAVTGLNAMFHFERENDALRGLLLTGADPAIVFASKLTVHLVFLLIIQLLVVLFHGLFFGVTYHESLGAMLWPWLLGNVGLISLGTLLAGLTSSFGHRDIMLPLLFYPLSVPIVASEIDLFRNALGGKSYQMLDFTFVLVAASALVFLTLGAVLFAFIVDGPRRG